MPRPLRDMEKEKFSTAMARSEYFISQGFIGICMFWIETSVQYTQDFSLHDFQLDWWHLDFNNLIDIDKNFIVKVNILNI